MTYRIELPWFMDQCPQYWKNFAYDELTGIGFEACTNELKKYNCKFFKSEIELKINRGEKYVDGIEFETEEAATFFKLKWS